MKPKDPTELGHVHMFLSCFEVKAAADKSVDFFCLVRDFCALTGSIENSSGKFRIVGHSEHLHF